MRDSDCGTLKGRIVAVAVCLSAGKLSHIYFYSPAAVSVTCGVLLSRRQSFGPRQVEGLPCNCSRESARVEIEVERICHLSTLILANFDAWHAKEEEAGASD